MKIYRLGSPWALLFLILPILCVVVIILSRFIFKKGVKITGVSLFKKGFSLGPYGYFITIGLTLLGMLIIAFSLSKPQYGMKKEKIISLGVDIMIALDVSRSMLYKKNNQPRIEAAKKIIVEFIKKRKGDRIGLVTFATTSFLRCPATINYDLLTRIIKKIFINPNKRSSTAIGLGLASAINRLIHLRDNEKIDSKIVILVTDGENNSGEITPTTATDIAKKMCIKIYTVGIGEADEIDIDLLKNIADKTGGRFYHAQSHGSLATIFDEIDELEKVKIEIMQFTRFKNIGYQYASLGIILMLLGLIMNTLFFKRLG